MVGFVDNYGLEKFWIEFFDALSLQERLVCCDGALWKYPRNWSGRKPS
jgi:hypothetical protein